MFEKRPPIKPRRIRMDRVTWVPWYCQQQVVLHSREATRGLAWLLLYVERHESRVAAMRREWHLKRDRRFRSALAGGLPGRAPEK